MAASHTSGMTMRTLLFGVILGLLTVVHSTPVHILDVTQIPAKAEDEVFSEAATDGFLVENVSLPSGETGSPLTGSPLTASTESPTTALTASPTTASTELPTTELPTTELPTTELPTTASTASPTTASTASPTTASPTTNSTVQASQLPAAVSNEGVAIEGSGGVTVGGVTVGGVTVDGVTVGGVTVGKPTTTVLLQFGATTASHASSSTSTTMPKETGDSSSVSSATQTPPSSLTPVPNEAQPSSTPDHVSALETTFGFLATQDSGSGSGSGSDDWETFAPYLTTTTRSSTTSSTQSTAALSPPPTGSEGSIKSITTGRDNRRMFNDQASLASQAENKANESLPIKAEGTPGWMIIVGFIVGLAALVMLFVAIATRDKWNGPTRASMLAEKTNSSNQQREMEMKTFLRKDEPRENGHGSEYTVIPLEELPEKHSSH